MRAVPGKTLDEIINNERIIGGLNKEFAVKAKNLYSSLVKGNIFIADTKTAEFVKLLEHAFRRVKILGIGKR